MADERRLLLIPRWYGKSVYYDSTGTDATPTSDPIIGVSDGTVTEYEVVKTPTLSTDDPEEETKKEKKLRKKMDKTRKWALKMKSFRT